MSTLTVCGADAIQDAQPAYLQTPADLREESTVEAENALLQSLVARRRQAIADSEAAYQSKLASQRDAECERLNDVLARVLARHNVSAAG